MLEGIGCDNMTAVLIHFKNWINLFLNFINQIFKIIELIIFLEE